MRKFVGALAAGLMLGCASIAIADPVPRNAPAAGSVIARKTGEEVRFIDVSLWRGVDIHQDLLAGDELRTNALGSLAVLFADNTQVRLGRNTVMVVKEINPGADSRFSLESGSIWARAERGGEGLVIETPAAAAAIRGTDWTMTVVGDRTSLTVLEGKVELSNALGSVTVVPGEAASARIGQAPTKTVIVAPDDREQMLFYLSLRDSFLILPASPLSSREMREERSKIAEIPEAARTGEQWLTLAEVALSYDGRAAAKRAADQARAFRLAPAQRARLDLVDAMIAASEKRYADAIPLFSRAAPRLSGSRRAMADYGGYFSRALVNPDRIEQPPSGEASGPAGAVAAAWTAGFLQDIPAAIKIVRRAEQRYPNDPTLPAVRAQLAILVDDRPQTEEAIQRALALDPDDPTALEARARYRVVVQSDLEGALADATRASELMPGSTSAWNLLGLVLSARDAEREAEAAFLKGVELDPQDPLARANLALLYLDQGRVAEAKAEIDTAMAEDPSFDIGLVARGRYHIQTGEMDRAVQDLLAASTANPAYANILLLLAAAYYEKGDKEPAEQALQNANRLDPNDPVTASAEVAIAANEYDSDRAIRAAQEALKRARARGGDYAALSASRDQGSTLNSAYRLQGLDAWGRFYGDVVFDPFSASALADQAIAGSPNPFTTSGDYDGQTVGEPVVADSALSSLFQGLLLDPQMLAGRSRGANLINRPFIEGAIQGGALGGDASGWTGEAEVKGYLAYPFPISFYGQFTKRDTEESRGEIQPDASRTSTEFDLLDKTVGGFGYLTLSPTPNDNIVLFASVQDNEDDLSNGLTVYVPPIGLPVTPNTSGLDSLSLLGSTYDRTVDDRTGGYGAAWSHTFGYRNVVSAGVFASGFKRRSLETARFLFLINDEFLLSGLGEQQVKTDSDSVLGSVNHTLGIGDLTLRYGAEGGMLKQNRTVSDLIYIPGVSRDQVTTETDYDLTTGRIYADTLYDITPNLKVEAGLFGTMFEGAALNEIRAEPRVGAAWAPFEGHWLRVGYIEESSALNAFTLAPVGVMGMQANQAPLDIGGKSSTFAARWEAQWSDHLFTAVDYQHQELDDLAIPVPLTLDQISLTEGRIDRVSATANLWLTHGFGAFATFAYANSENRDPTSLSYGGLIPYVPEQMARLGLTWVSTADVKVTVAASYVGERSGGDSGIMLDPYWTADAFLTWEPLDKRFELELAAYNLFDEEFEVAPNTPGWGRVFTGSLKMRF
ncbi:FecR domain-containing protein [Mesorhizobium sp. IMUNJ 23232]|uniref:FecR domain-containing protein n=1 Tax=Mesorhizobium sp. IMUNJ 23232 TaxID=3376064 RepID=UPI0037ADC891